MSEKRTIVITNCTQRKRSVGPVICAQEILLDVLEPPSLDAAAHRWLQAVASAQDKLPADQTYGGRSFSEAKWVAEHLKAELYVVSAGLGLLCRQSPVPNYNLTVANGSGSIQGLLEKYEAAPSDWWTVLTEVTGSSNPVQRLVHSTEVNQVFIALPSAYLHLLKKDISGIEPKYAEKLRVFTSPLGMQALPPHLSGCVLPYDERLEGIYPGTRTDFPQRSLRHFTTTFTLDLPSAEAHLHVKKTLAKATKPTIPIRQRRSDMEIVDLLYSEWNRFNGSSTRLLRFLRDDALVACEQSRFRDLWRRVAAMNKDSE